MNLNKTPNPLNREARNKENENWDKIEKSFKEVVEEVSDRAFDKVIDGSKIDWSQMVDDIADLSNDAGEGETRGVKSDNKIYRFNGTDWVPIAEINLNPIAEVDQRLTTQLVETNEYFSKSGLSNRRTPYPMITWIDDDGKEGLYTKLYPIFSSKGIPFTSAIIPNRVGASGYVTESEIKEMMSYGLEIVSHTNEHDPNNRPIDLPKEQLREGYRSAKQKIVEWGGNPHCVVYPFGNYNETIDEVAREFHDYAFDIGTTKGMVEPPLNTYKIPRYNPFNKTISEVKEKLDEVYSKNSWIVIISHADESAYDENMAIELVDYAISKGFEFVTTAKGIGYHGNLLELDANNTIDKYGNINSRRLGTVYHSKNNEFLATDPWDKFDLGVTITKIDQTDPSNTEGLPSNIAGTLVTYKTSNEDIFTHQTFYAYGRSLVAYRSARNGAWRDWIVPNFVVQGDVTYDDTTPPNEFPVGTFTMRITQPNAQNTPDNRGGIIVTVKANLSSFIWSYQTFYDVAKNEIYTRNAISDSVWGNWKKSNNVYFTEINEVNANTPISAFENGINHTYIRANSSGLPENKQSGNLITYKEDGATRSYQTFRAAGGVDKYIRSDLSDGSWTPWRKFVVQDV